MMLKLRENLPVIIENHPFHESLNNKILEENSKKGYQKTLSSWRLLESRLCRFCNRHDGIFFDAMVAFYAIARSKG